MSGKSIGGGASIFGFPKWFHLGPPDLAGRSVILIGPAETAADELREVDLQAYDHVARMNNAIDTPIVYRDQPYFFHDLYFRNQARNARDSTAGHLTAESLVRNGTRIIVFALYSWRDLRRLAKKLFAISRMRREIEVYVLTPSFLREVASRISPFKPTMGFIAISMLLGQKLKRLDLLGLTFFSTRYIPGYNDGIGSGEQAIAWSTRTGKHDPRVEKIAVREMIVDARKQGCKLYLGQHLAEILDLSPHPIRGASDEESGNSVRHGLSLRR